MKLAEFHEIFLVLSFVIVQFTVKPVASNLSYENKNFVKTKQDPTRFQLASAYRNQNNHYATRYHRNTTTQRKNNNVKPNVVSRRNPQGIGGNYSQDKHKIGHNSNKAIPQTSQTKKWQVGRVSRKQYEIINMLWRKTKIFADVEPTPANHIFRQNNDTLRNIRQPFIRYSTTPSYIEFYYLDETDELVKQFTTQKHIQSSTLREHFIRNHGSNKFVLSDSPMISFRIHDPRYKRPEITTRHAQPTSKKNQSKGRARASSLLGLDYLNSLTPLHKHPRTTTQQNIFLTNATTSSIPQRYDMLNLSNTMSSTEYIDDNETCPTTADFETVNDTSESANITNDTVTVIQEQKSTTAYDKIKFFEMYDKHTRIPDYDEKGKLYGINNVDIFIKGNKLNNNERKVLLEHVDQSVNNGHSKSHKVKHAKKSIVDNYKSQSSNQSGANLLRPKLTVKPAKLNVSNVKQDVTKQTKTKLLQSHPRGSPQLQKFFNSQYVKWSEYPFAAVYVYEPSQVHCDAAGISPHWLITSGSCLSRHHKNPGGVGRSAFVTYCGTTWWNPERVAYVKHSVVHPRFNPREKTKKHLYNIGLIQVVTSMQSACSGWSSISLMSHQIIAAEEGAVANAIGWGLDRFDTRYSSKDLPKSVLTSYQNQVYTHSCPGNVAYEKAKRMDEDGSIKNIYCLALPPYSGEPSDPIHGGLLLVGGKLVALYLQNGQVRSTLNRGACMTRCMNVDEAKGVCVRIVPGGVLWFMPTPMGQRRELMKKGGLGVSSVLSTPALGASSLGYSTSLVRTMTWILSPLTSNL